MASNGFRFPPPPPPPPPRALDNSQLSGHADATGSANWRGGRGRGRGLAPGQKQYDHRNGFSRGAFAGSQDRSGRGQREFSGRGSFGGSQPRGQKRRHDQAFVGNNRASERPNAPPSVPSFGFDVNSILSSTDTYGKLGASTGRSQPPKRNVFGLAPSMDDNDYDKDEEEESDLAKSYQSKDSSLQISYAGRTMSLNTPEELAAWIAERKKRFPTKAKAEEAAEKAKAEAAERAQQKSSRKEGRNKKPKLNKKENKTMVEIQAGGQASQAQAEARRLQKELEKAQKRVAELEKAQSIQEPEKAVDRIPAHEQQDPLAGAIPMPSAAKEVEGVDIHGLIASSSDNELLDATGSDPKEGNDDTSSSGTSDGGNADDDDGAPPEISSKIPEEQTLSQTPRDRPICRDFTRHGRCPRGLRCHFKHEPIQGITEKGQKRILPGHGLVRGKTLFQRLQEQQQEMTEELILQHILYLGDHGFLDEPNGGNDMK